MMQARHLTVYRSICPQPFDNPLFPLINCYGFLSQTITKAAENGSAFGRGFLGIMHIEGKAVDKDFIKAYAWLNIVSHWQMYKEDRDKLEAKMSPKEVIRAQKLSQQLIEKYGKTKD
jgi:hypothetical protein